MYAKPLIFPGPRTHSPARDPARMSPELTLPTPAENLALDEALLDDAEENGRHDTILRLWESPQAMVVIGRSSKIAVEANLDVCRAANVPVLRRSSGGAAIVAGPGCLMYAVILSRERFADIEQVQVANALVLGRIAAGLRTLLPQIELNGNSDLTLDGRKFSGNSLRVKRTHTLYHGTMLYDFPLSSVGELLGTPPRQPEYRAGRTHGEFICNLPLTREQLVAAVGGAWPDAVPPGDWPRERTAALVAEKYGRQEWHERL